MEINEAEQLDTLNQPVKCVNKNQDTEETDALATPKEESRFSSPLDSQDTQTEIVMAGRRDTDLTSHTSWPKWQ